MILFIFLYFSKPVKKIPMNEISPKHVAIATNNGALLDLDFFTKKPEGRAKVTTPEPVKPFSPTDDVMVDISTNESQNACSVSNNNISPKADSPLDNILDLGLPLVNKCDVETPVECKDNSIERKDSKKISDVKPLTDINVTLQSIQPSKVPPVTAFEEEGGLTVVLHSCKDKPRPDVNVVVISTTSKSSSSIEDYKFQAVVPKVLFKFFVLLLINTYPKISFLVIIISLDNTGLSLLSVA